MLIHFYQSSILQDWFLMKLYRHEPFKSFVSKRTGNLCVYGCLHENDIYPFNLSPKRYRLQKYP